MTNAQAAVIACAHSINFNSARDTTMDGVVKRVKEWLDEQDRLDFERLLLPGPSETGG